MDDLGLERALRCYLQDWSAKSKVPAHLYSSLGQSRFPAVIEITLYRIIREALNNVIKHAGAKQISLILEHRLDHAVAIIEDDGNGFDPVAFTAAAHTQLGIAGMRERAEALGGTLTVKSRLRRGTTLFVRIPLTNTWSPAMPKIRVLIADDHAVVREGLKRLLEQEPDLQTVGEAIDGLDAVNQAIGLRPDIVVMDLTMPKLSGMEATYQLRVHAPTVKVLALSIHEDRCYLHGLLEAGAAGYLLKRAAAQELIRAIRTVASGGTHIDPRVAGKLVSHSPHLPKLLETGPDPLTEREAAVLRAIALGFSNKEIAAEMGLSVKTVETYKTRASFKVGLNSRVDIVRYALAKGWLKNGEPDPA